MKKGLFNFWWCMGFAILSCMLLLQAIEEGSVVFIWMNGIALPLWLLFAWQRKQMDALEEETGKDNDRQGD